MRRRQVTGGLIGATALALPGGIGRVLAGEAVPQLDPALPAGTRAEAVMDTLPGKKPLVKLAYRPPNYEAPLAAFRTALTSNDEFFVRYHLAGIPEEAELGRWSLRVDGDAVTTPVTFSLEDLKTRFEPVEVTAVCQCSGNRRGLFQPHVSGVQWGYGGMGNAVWRGVRLHDILARAGIKAGAVEVAMGGADGPVLEATPDFAKSIPMAKALEDDTIVAFAMNGATLPHLNGFPARLVVPGWTATYWLKHLTSLEVRSTPFQGYWMQKAYRVPRGLFATDLPFTTQETATTAPITQILVNSLVTNLESGARVPAAGFDVEGIAWDGGHGIKTVEVSTDAGRSWRPAELGRDLGRFSFRSWHFHPAAQGPGPVTIMVRATNRAGSTQADRLVPNPAGYQHNVIQTLSLSVA